MEILNEKHVARTNHPNYSDEDYHKIASIHESFKLTYSEDTIKMISPRECYTSNYDKVDTNNQDQTSAIPPGQPFTLTKK